ncbi:T9SS type A sorting domain-containing protein [Chryseobacterium oncorhynchi]|uniref:T9SS C-terminal target domain-containing protein n=1 Tax=Chryseobacterium oncorhynchi TaxID=741074 RepID=A0A316WF40_9FLAO|nr:T9SS type A sorting domain-containing protein [Chryseobacterium oncorhynchi]PWN60095.1 T9SS C-terminal target domain-containing protein [Chryseobacterium oncorhynchi]
MRKSLFAIGLLAISYSVQAQILCHVDTNANMYVSEGTLVYSGGGVQTKGNGLLDVHGNIMVVGSGTDAFKTIDAGGADKTDGGNIVLRLNTPATYASSTYGQLYIDGLSQSNVTGVVSKEYLTDKQGTGNYFQQIALPFFGKAYNSLSTELGKTFGTARDIQNTNSVNNDLILQWNNLQAKSDHVTSLASTTSNGTGYYMLGSRNNNLNLNVPPTPASVYTLSGRPYAPLASVSLQNGGNVYFGPNGNGANSYGEAYNSYLQDQFDLPNGAWNPTYGKNIYQFGNPFLTNLDLSKIGFIENGTVTDGNNVSNIMGIEYTSGNVVTLANGYTYTTGALTQTFNLDGTPVGDIGLLIKPMQPFIIKLRDNSAQTLNFNTLRRFKNSVRANGTDYNVNAARISNKSNSASVKQLGVIGLDASGNEIARTYYVVSPTATTGHQISIATTVQAAASSASPIGTFEEALNGGYDPNYNAKYWLYINEASESNFLGKDILLYNFDYAKPDKKIVSYKFEIRENAEMIPAGVHNLSSGIGFFYKASNGTVQEAKQGDVIPVSSKSYNLYYGAPDRGSLATKETETLSRTMVVYNPAISNYIVRFDPDWRKADIEVYDMSGKLIISKKSVDASRDFVIELDGSVKSSYIVKVVSDKGVIVNTKILK